MAQSISRRFSYAFIGVVTVFLFGFAAVAILLNLKRIDNELEARLDNALKLAQVSLPTPLWNLDNDVVDDFVGALFLDDAIVYARVSWESQIIAERKNPKFDEKVFRSQNQSSRFISKTSEVLFEGRKVGTIQIVLSRERGRKQLVLQIYGILALTTVIIVAISLTSMATTRRYIIRPLHRLQESASLIARGDLETPIDTASSDEIGGLAKNLDVMRGSIKQLFGELERTSHLKRFFSPQLVEFIVSSGGDELMESHRREISVVFCDLRNFTEFSGTAEPEEQLQVLREYHEVVGSLIFRYQATLEHFAGDGVMSFFNDPVPCPDPAARAIRMAIDMRQEVGKLLKKWEKRGFGLGFGVGVDLGYATLGQVGFEGQFHYMAIGSVANLAARLCDRARDGQILVTQRVCVEVEDVAEVEFMGEFSFKGFHKPVSVFHVLGISDS